MSCTFISVAVLLVLLLAGSIIAPLAAAETGAEDRTITAVAGQVDATNQDDVAVPQEPSLPEGLSRIFASLGLYIVTMFTMAIGTEIMVDVFKLALGLKSKPSAMKTIKEYEKLLPGTLDGLGLAAEARLQVENQLAALKSILAPAFRVETIAVSLRQKNFTDALAAAGLKGQGAATVEQARDILKEQIREAVNRISRRSALGISLGESFMAKIEQIIDDKAAMAANITPEELFEFGVDLIHNEMANALTTWMEQQIEQLRSTSYETAQRTYDLQLRPLIITSGLSNATQNKIERQFETFLENLKSYKGSDVYLQAVNKLLLDVERQRNELRSYIGKVWLKVRNSGRRLLGNWFDVKEMTPETQSIQIEHPAEAASKLMAIESRDKNEEKKRIERLRFVSVLVATLLAYLLQIDSADLLRDLFPADANFLYVTLIRSDSAILTWIGNVFNVSMNPLTAGIILTGLAASAGSSFWHDQLSRLQAVKKGAESAYAALQPIIISQQKTEENS